MSENRELSAAKRFIRKALKRHGRPDRIVIDGGQTNREAIIACDSENRLRDRLRRTLKPILIRSMLGFKSMTCAATILSGIEMVHMMRKRQARYAYRPAPSIAEQFEILAA